MIISFYSYKGGVGRSQLCANIAAYLCYVKKKKILLWDWDFEAPGLHYFFGKSNKDINVPGTIEMLETYVRLMRTKDTVFLKDLEFIDRMSIINLIKAPEGDTDPNAVEEYGEIDLLPGGNYEDDFSYRVNNFNWFEFYNLLDGVNYIEELKKWIKTSAYDYILIDSRTGINDYSGICNVQLPDINVFVIAANNQNFDGNERIIRRIIESDYIKEGFRKPYIFPILSRLDKNHPNFENWVEQFSERFNFLLENIDTTIEESLRKYIFKDFFLDKTFLEYTPSFSAGENLLINSPSQKTSSLSYVSKFINIAEYIENLTFSTTEKDKKISIGLYNQISIEDWNYYAQNAQTEEQKNVAASIAERLQGNTAFHFFEIGKIKYQDGNLEDAIEAFELSINFDPEFFRAFFYLGRIYMDLYNFKEASVCFEKVLKIKPKDYETYFYMGLNYFKQTFLVVLQEEIEPLLNKAIKYSQKAIKLHNNFTEAYIQLGEIFLKKNELDSAKFYFEKAIKLNPNDIRISNNLGLINLNLDNLQEAISNFQYSIKIAPKASEAYSNLGFCYLKLKDFENAELNFREAISYGDRDIAYMNLGHIYLIEKNIPMALNNYSECLKNMKPQSIFFKTILDDYPFLNKFDITKDVFKNILLRLGISNSQLKMLENI